jgi:IS5 family transposase
MPSLGDPEMRHGRKSKKKPFTGYKRHFIKAVEGDLILGALVLPANEAEQDALAPLLADAERHAPVDEMLMDRGYLGSPTVQSLRARGTSICCKPWPSRNGGRFTKEDFGIDLQRQAVTCPARITARIAPDTLIARFPAATCLACSSRGACTTAEGRGRSISIHPQEALLIELRTARKSPEGRRALRRRTTIEHSLARVAGVQGARARYRGARKNTFDARRCGAVINLQTVARIRRQAVAG